MEFQFGWYWAETRENAQTVSTAHISILPTRMIDKRFPDTRHGSCSPNNQSNTGLVG